MMYVFWLAKVVLGAYFIKSGVNHFLNRAMLAGYAGSKGLPMPMAGVLVSGVMMTLGGLGIISGMYMTVAVWLCVVFLVAAAFGIHTFWKVQDPMAKMGEQINFEKNLALAAALLLVLM